MNIGMKNIKSNLVLIAERLIRSLRSQVLHERSVATTRRFIRFLSLANLLCLIAAARAQPQTIQHSGALPQSAGKLPHERTQTSRLGINDIVFSPHNQLVAVETTSYKGTGKDSARTQVWMFDLKGNLKYRLSLYPSNLLDPSFYGFVNSGNDIVVKTAKGLAVRRTSDGGFVRRLAEGYGIRTMFIGTNFKSIVAFLAEDSHNRAILLKWDVNNDRSITYHSSATRMLAHGSEYFMTTDLRRAIGSVPNQYLWPIIMQFQYLDNINLSFSPDSRYVSVQHRRIIKFADASRWKVIFRPGQKLTRPFKMYCSPLAVSPITVKNPTFSHEFWSSKGWQVLHLDSTVPWSAWLRGLANNGDYVALVGGNRVVTLYIVRVLRRPNSIAGELVSKLLMK